ncbi:MAG: hypothetical protein ACREEX_03365, partial [Caulobacteraceae bacterium]
QWISYMATQGAGNLCNYWIFVTLVSLHRGAISNPYIALVIAAFVAWMINYVGVRALVFGRGHAGSAGRGGRLASRERLALDMSGDEANADRLAAPGFSGPAPGGIGGWNGGAVAEGAREGP